MATSKPFGLVVSMDEDYVTSFANTKKADKNTPWKNSTDIPQSTNNCQSDFTHFFISVGSNNLPLQKPRHKNRLRQPI